MIRKIFIVVGLVVFAGFAMLTLDKFFHIVPAPEYHWYHVSDENERKGCSNCTDQWTYSTTKLEEPLFLRAPDGTLKFIPSPREFVPDGLIRTTSEGAWKAEVLTSAGGYFRSCGVGEYISRDLAEQCVEKTVKDAQGPFGGYRIERRK